MAAAQPAPLQTVHVGEIDVTFLPDGEAHFSPTGMFPASGSAEAWAAHERWLDDDGRYVTTIGAFLVRTGDRNVLVDLGLGVAEIEIPDFATARTGRFLDSLTEAGLAPADVDTVVYTHLHSDHCGWTSNDGALTFPNAEHVVGAAAEVEFWRANPEVPFAPPADTVLDPLADRLTIAGDGYAVAPGVTLVATPGHTPGHQTVVVSSGSERAVIMGDILHCPVQLVEPEWSVLFDIDPAAARATREKLLDELAAEDVTVACGHFPEAAFGRVLRGEGKRYWQVG